MKKLKVNKMYKIIKTIKLHTKPLYEVEVIQEGRFLRETKFFYIFDSFKVSKEKIIKLEMLK